MKDDKEKRQELPRLQRSSRGGLQGIPQEKRVSRKIQNHHSTEARESIHNILWSIDKEIVSLEGGGHLPSSLSRSRASQQLPSTTSREANSTSLLSPLSRIMDSSGRVRDRPTDGSPGRRQSSPLMGSIKDERESFKVYEKLRSFALSSGPQSGKNVRSPGGVISHASREMLYTGLHAKEYESSERPKSFSTEQQKASVGAAPNMSKQSKLSLVKWDGLQSPGPPKVRKTVDSVYGIEVDFPSNTTGQSGCLLDENAMYSQIELSPAEDMKFAKKVRTGQKKKKKEQAWQTHVPRSRGCRWRRCLSYNIRARALWRRPI